MTQADVISKALIDLTQALIEKSNQKGLEQIEALKELNDILNNVPESAQAQNEGATPEQRQVIFEAATKSPQKPETRDLTPHPRVNEPTQRTSHG
jgi:hypothetical protein